MKFKLLLLAVILTASPFTASFAKRSEHDRRDCIIYYQEAEKYVSIASSILWDVYQSRVIDFDQYNAIFNEMVLRARKPISDIRERSYVGYSHECKSLYWETVQVVNQVLKGHR